MKRADRRRIGRQDRPAPAAAVVVPRSAAVFVDNRPEAVRQRKRIDGMNRTAAQRKVFIDGDRFRPSYLRARGVPEYLVGIVRVWDGADTEHRFANWDDFTNAVGKASRKQMGAVPALYSQANFRFMTKEGGRLPSLYFVQSATNHGRIRQQHGRGPVIDELPGSKIDLFIDASAGFDELMDRAWRASNGWKQGLSDNSSNYLRLRLTQLGATARAAAGKQHLEVVPAVGPVTWVHESGGTVQLPTADYDDAKIRAIYLATVGRED